MHRRECSQFRRLRLGNACINAVFMYSLGQQFVHSICQHLLSNETVGRRTSTIGLHRLGTTAAKASQVRIPPGNAITANTHEETRSTSGPTGSPCLRGRLDSFRFFHVSARESDVFWNQVWYFSLC
jgi:hypothetical protein